MPAIRRARLAGGVERRAEDDGKHRAGRGDHVGDDAVLEVDQRRGHDEQDQHDAQHDPAGRAVREHRATQSAAVSASTSG